MANVGISEGAFGYWGGFMVKASLIPSQLGACTAYVICIFLRNLASLRGGQTPRQPMRGLPFFLFLRLTPSDISENLKDIHGEIPLRLYMLMLAPILVFLALLRNLK
jgi:hypothetical protein